MDFESLKELAKSVKRQKIKKIEVITNLEKSNNKIFQLYDGLANNKFKDEKEAVRHLFKSYDIKNVSYQKIKNKLIKQLENSILFIDVDQPIFNDRAKSYFVAFKDVAVSTLMLTRDSSKPAIYILQKVLEQAIKYEFIDIASSVLKIIRTQYYTYMPGSDKYNYYANLHRKYEKMRKWESKSQDYFETLVLCYIQKRFSNHLIYESAIKYHEKLAKRTNILDTSFFYRNIYNINIIKYCAINDLQNAFNVCNNAIEDLGNRPNTHRSTIIALYNQKIGLLTHMKLGDINEYNQTIDYSLSNTEKGSFNWFRAHEGAFYLRATHKDFQSCLWHFSQSVNSDRFTIIEGIYHDNWLLLGGYLHLLARLNQLDPQEVESVVGKFRYSKLFNEIEVLKKDKEGMNIPLILLPVLYELAQEPGKSIKEIPTDGLEKYRQRWLANDLNRRSNSFFRIVITLAQHQVLTAQQKKKINRELAIIRSETPEIARQHFAIEVIPYETLTELLLEKMGLFSILEQPEPLATN